MEKLLSDKVVAVFQVSPSTTIAVSVGGEVAIRQVLARAISEPNAQLEAARRANWRPGEPLTETVESVVKLSAADIARVGRMVEAAVKDVLP